MEATIDFDAIQERIASVKRRIEAAQQVIDGGSVTRERLAEALGHMAGIEGSLADLTGEVSTIVGRSQGHG